MEAKCRISSGSSASGRVHTSNARHSNTTTEASTSYRWSQRNVGLGYGSTAPSVQLGARGRASSAWIPGVCSQQLCSRRTMTIVGAQKINARVASKATMDLLEGKLRRRSDPLSGWILPSMLQQLYETAATAWPLEQQAVLTSSKSKPSRSSKGGRRSGAGSAAATASPAATTAASKAGVQNPLSPAVDKVKQHVSDLMSAIADLAPRLSPLSKTQTSASASSKPAARTPRRPTTGTVVMRATRTSTLTQPPAGQKQQQKEQHAAEALTAAAGPEPQPEPQAADSNGRAFKLWALFVLAISYVHQSTTASSVPAMLPMIGPDLGLNDFQGAMLTTGYSYLYALALVPVGLLADRVDRPKLLAGGLALWSGLTMAAAHVGSFKELIIARVGFAAAQAAQNPISFSLIPDLFPAQKSTAMAVYNCAIYLGRALSFGAVIQAKNMQAPAMDAAAGAVADAARQAGKAAAVAAGGIMVPLDKLDLSRVSILYINGDSAVIAPVYSYGLQMQMMQASTAVAEMHDGAWRDVLTMLAVPGFVISGLLLATVADPKKKEQQALEQQQQQQQQPGRRAVQTIDVSPSLSSSSPSSSQAQSDGGAAAGVLSLLTSSAFMTVTLAAALNDVGSYAFLAWQSTFYERVYHLEPAAYAPMLAAVLPIGGIIGGVGGGLLADALSKIGQRYWLTVGASMLSAPLIADSVLASTSEESFLALLLGFGLAEAWRAPSAVLIRTIAPASMGSTASALYLCVRNLVGGLGPLAVAKLADVVGLQRAMLLAPACYAASGLLFLAAEVIVKQRETRLAAAAGQQQ